MGEEMEGWRCKLELSEKKRNRLVPDFPHSAGTVLKLKSNGARKPDRLLRCLPALPRLIERKLAPRQRWRAGPMASSPSSNSAADVVGKFSGVFPAFDASGRQRRQQRECACFHRKYYDFNRLDGKYVFFGIGG